MPDIEWSQLEEIDWLFRRMVRRFIKERDKISIEGVALPAVLILRKMDLDGEQKLSDLADQLDLTSGAITGLCDKLEMKGFAVRRRLEEDRRTVLLTITDEGRRMLNRNRNVGKRCITLLFGDFKEQELELQREIFTRITDHLEGFAETILAMSKDLEKKPSKEVNHDTRFLSY